MKTLLGEKLHFDWKIVTITIVSTLLIMIDYYHQAVTSLLLSKMGYPLSNYWGEYWDRLILYLIVPLAIVLLLFRENPKEFGFALGDWKAGLIITAIGILCMAPIIYY